MVASRLGLAVSCTLLALCVLASPASAWDLGVDPATQITSPSSGISGFWNFETDAGSADVAVQGMVTAGDADGNAYIRMACLRFPTDPPQFLSPIIHADAGTHLFSATVRYKDLAALSSDAGWADAPKSCQLRAVPVTSGGALESGDPALRTGPSMTVSSIRKNADGNLVGVLSLPTGGFRIGLPGDTDSPSQGRVIAPYESGGVLPYTFGTIHTNGGQATLDGGTAWFASGVPAALRSKAGYVAPTWTVDFATLTIVETDRLLTCPSQTLDAFGQLTGCDGGFSDSGVVLTRTLKVTGGTLSIDDSYLATGAHTLAVYYSDTQNFRGSTPVFDETELEYTTPTDGTKFKPGDFAHKTILSGADLPAVGTFFVDNSTAPSGSTDSARGALTYAPAANEAWIFAGGIVNAYTNIGLSPGVAVHIKAAVTQAQDDTSLQSLASAAQVALGGTPALPPPTAGGSNGGGALPAAPTIVVGKAKATRDKKSKRATISSGKSAVCPVSGGECTATWTLTATYKSGKKTKSAYLHQVELRVKPGTTTPMSFPLPKKADKLFTKLKRLKFTIELSVTGNGRTADSKSSVTLKAPKAAKKKK